MGLAAERLHVTKAAVSARIKQLEASLGVELFQRRHDGLRLSAAGWRFHRGARSVQDQWERARWEACQEGGVRRHVSLGAHPALADDLLIDWIAPCEGLSSTRQVVYHSYPSSTKARGKAVFNHPDDTIDLHRKTVEESIIMVQNFIITSRSRMYDSVLIITGWERHFDRFGPRIKKAVELSLWKVGKSYVPGFFQAPGKYGGKGAICVKLIESDRRRKYRRPISEGRV